MRIEMRVVFIQWGGGPLMGRGSVDGEGVPLILATDGELFSSNSIVSDDERHQSVTQHIT